VTGVKLVARLREAVDATGEPDWSLVRPDVEIHDHELLDSAVHHGREGWKRWTSDWQQSFEDYSIERLHEIEVDQDRVLTVHRLRARGRLSGVQLERTDAQLWTFTEGRLARLDYYPDYREGAQPWN
jgi:ketosteroid isomerase-like protein